MFCSLEATRQARLLFEFLGLPFDLRAQRALDSLTAPEEVDDEDDPYSTVRRSAAQAFAWKKDVDCQTMMDVQRHVNCSPNALRMILFFAFSFQSMQGDPPEAWISRARLLRAGP